VARGLHFPYYFFCTTPEKQARLGSIENVPKTNRHAAPVLDLEWNPFAPPATTAPARRYRTQNTLIFLRILKGALRPATDYLHGTDFLRDATQLGPLRDVEFRLRSKPPAHPSGENYPRMNAEPSGNIPAQARVTGSAGLTSTSMSMPAAPPAGKTGFRGVRCGKGRESIYQGAIFGHCNYKVNLAQISKRKWQGT